MYIFFFILILINLILIAKYNFFQKYFLLYDKKTGVPLIGGIYLFINFFIIGIYFFYDPNSIFGNYFKNFILIKKYICKKILVFFCYQLYFFN